MASSPPRLRSTGLAGEEVHIWPVRLVASDGVVEAYRAFLSAEERDRAARFKFEHLRRAFSISRGALRALLGCYTGGAPEEVVFAYGEKGKPSLAGSSRLRFNTSHSGDLALYAFAFECELGVDIEHFRPMNDLQDIARKFFSAPEVSDLESLPPNDRIAGFFRCWTRKEAYIKSTGEGLSMPLDSFRVTFLPDSPARIIPLAKNAGAAEVWSLHNLDVAAGYAGALAYAGNPRSLFMQPLLSGEELFTKIARK